MTYYAKPEETYEQHIDACFEAWQETTSAMHYFLERQASLFHFSVERFLMGSLLTIAFHDSGKLTDKFQTMMLCIREHRDFDFRKNYRHELVSCSVMMPYWASLETQSRLSQLPVEVLAVAAHHKQLDSDLTSFEKERLLQMPQLTPDATYFGTALAEDLFRRRGWALPTPVPISEPLNSLRFLSTLFGINGTLDRFIDQEGEGIERTRFIYSLLRAILHYSDWYASGHVHVDYSTTIDYKDVERTLVNRCKEKDFEFEGFRPFQYRCWNTEDNLIAVAPTGSGKTEAALLWAVRNKNALKGSKILYLLPTMSTANSTWKRVCDIAGREHVGLSHSTATLVREMDGEPAEDKWADRRDALFDESFIKPITVATVDQLLSTGFNLGRWTLKETNTANAAIIIDEIHAYDGWTLGLLIASIRHFQQFGARFLVMTATMPSNLCLLLNKELDNPLFVSEETLLQAKRSRYYVCDSQITDAIPEIETAVRAGLRVLVVVNTVKGCQELAKSLEHLKPVCYHSMFILRDRRDREAVIEHAQFVIATQVVEVSLDIDYDWLFTECAPPDAIAQRAGRVNRYRDPGRDSRVYIYRYSDVAQKRVYCAINDPTLLERSFQAFKTNAQGKQLSETDLMNIVENVYKDYHIEETQAFKDAVDEYKISQEDHGAILDNRNKSEREVTREVQYATMTIIPEVFQQQFFQAYPASERRGYEVKVPFWYAKKNLHPVDDIPFCAVDYDSDYGVSLSTPPPGYLEI